ncbi:HTH-type transcriptional activator HxlR [Pseudomonas oleovorans subsp. oleovorans]|uniref:Transcription regulator protein n=1 Tax=Ectopseudomonas oleovorans TaxID=301 RepID=A0A379JRG7_ECTOL|nr:helix-turn-helix domain-containing protein [Pseudomonas oleovorans]OWK48561.1 HTH-type transcriptional activator HxlR [Pseudomonas oleovorans subsp. oleovorans]SEJ48882.1 transcriptional regulator, HxlR family [Pseudomonas oleovorans]SUD50593.1 transcription regulator protein [Pseudomonas oleovorans]
MPDDVRLGNVFSGVCPARHVLAVIADKWSLLLIHALAHGGTLRTAELRRRVEGISEKMLIQTIRRLERFGLVARQAYAEVPPRVEYSLTPLGHSLIEPIRAIDHWVERNVAEIARAQQAFDQAGELATDPLQRVIAG